MKFSPKLFELLNFVNFEKEDIATAAARIAQFQFDAWLSQGKTVYTYWNNPDPVLDDEYHKWCHSCEFNHPTHKAILVCVEKIEEKND